MIKKIYKMSKDELEFHQAKYNKEAVALGSVFTDIARGLLIKMLRNEGLKIEEREINMAEQWEPYGYKFMDVQLQNRPDAPANGIYLMKWIDGKYIPVACVTTAFIDNTGTANFTYYDFRSDDATDIGGIKLPL